MTDDSEKRNRRLAFELQNSHVCEKRSNEYSKRQFVPLREISPTTLQKRAH